MPETSLLSQADALRELPAALQDGVASHWADYVAACGGQPLLQAPEALRSLARVWAASRFVAGTCVRAPALLQNLVGSGDLDRCYEDGEYGSRVAAVLDGAAVEEQLMRRLRHCRRREMVRIAWRDLDRRTDLNGTVRDLTALADACVSGALVRLHELQAVEWGTPVDSTGRRLDMVVLAMGKLGGEELNFSSDIDLIFAYPEDGETVGGRRGTSNHEYFVRLGQRLIHVLNQPTAEGFVFRVDMRLRPFGASGPLVMSFSALEGYYASQGRDWERYAMVKARVVTGQAVHARRLLATLRPFVYRRYLDYGAFEALRQMKALIVQEVQRKGLHDDVKLGAGGIREVEFVAQAFQLIRGGRVPELRDRRVLVVLERLRQRGNLPEFVVRQLHEAYVFLRNVEHRIQAYADEQSQTLPQDSTVRSALAYAMGYPDWDAFDRDLRMHRRRVHNHFEQIVAAPQAEAAGLSGAEVDLAAVWLGSAEGEQAESVLAHAGYDDVQDAHRHLTELRRGSRLHALSARGRERVDRLMPMVLGAAGRTGTPTETLRRVLGVLEAVAGRTTYLTLLVEHPMALSQLVKLCAASPWLAKLLARHPVLLDELLDPRTLYAPLDRQALEAELAQRMAATDADDVEQHMELLRQFKQAHVLRVAAADVAKAYPLMVVSDHLTTIAEVVLRGALQLTWHYLQQRHGRPPCEVASPGDTGFVIIGYGKLGGIELGYGSDLDLVFLHGAAVDGPATEGPRSIESGVFYARLGQRLVHMLSTHTPAGVLYEVDTRLRPSGASGLLVTGIAGFDLYQRERAWTWEHQALVRARPVAGDPALARRFLETRRVVLSRAREPEMLRREVREMRERMRAALGGRRGGLLDLKQDPGGIADIEFVVQYGVLLLAHAHPELLEYTDNIRLLAGLARVGFLAASDAEALADAYRGLRKAVHRLTLQEAPRAVEAEALAEERAIVAHLWQSVIGDE